MEDMKNPKPYNVKGLLAEIAKYDPELAQEISEGAEPAEERIARELAFAKAIRDQKVRDLDFETFMTVGEIWIRLINWLTSHLTRMNMLFLQNYTAQMTALADMFIPPPPQVDHKTLIAKELVEMAREMRQDLKSMMNIPMMGAKVPLKEVKDEDDGKEYPDAPADNILQMFSIERANRKSNKCSKSKKR